MAWLAESFKDPINNMIGTIGLIVSTELLLHAMYTHHQSLHYVHIRIFLVMCALVGNLFRLIIRKLKDE